MQEHLFFVGRGKAYAFAVNRLGSVTAVPRSDGTTPVIGGQLDLSADIAGPGDWSEVQEATGNNARISDGKELYAGAGFGDPLIEGQVDDVLWSFGPDGPPSSGRLLEVGCGPGFLLEALQRRLPGWTMVGVDPSPESVGQARARGITCHLGTLDSAQLTGGFDAFAVMGNFQLHPDPGASLRRAIALANPGATLYLDSKNPTSSTRRLARRLMTTPGVRRVGAVNAFAAHAFHGLRFAYTQEELCALLAGAGWRVSDVRTTAPRLLRFGNTHDLSRGPQGLVWRALDRVDVLTNQQAWIQAAAHVASA